MTSSIKRVAAACWVALTLSACGGSGGGGGSASAPVPPPAAAAPFTAADASRLAKQASFGPTQALIDHMTAVGLSGWLDEQFAAGGSSYADLAGRTIAKNACQSLTGQAATDCNRDYLSSTPVAMRFYADAAGGADQLRQRVAFALSELIVASDFEVHSTAGLAAFNQIFLDNAFGNYRDILKATTLNPYMGDYLDMADSSKTNPNENYARELMQLFSLGVNQLNMDGTPKRDGAGAPLPTYTPTDVHEVARALTGWTYARLNGAAQSDGNQLDYAHPMTPIPARYDTAAKTFLGVAVAANATQEASVDAVVDAVFNHPNTAPFVSRALIQFLTTSNPTPGYVQRVATVFANNGSGVRGDLKAVVRAILTDAEARGDARNGASDGKLKEPVLLSLSLARLFAARTDGYAFTTRDAALGQAPFRAASVFNFYPPDYPLPRGGGLLSPASKLLTTATAIARHNLIYDWTIAGDTRSEFTASTVIAGATGTQPDWSSWEALGADTEALLARVDLLLLNRTMTTAQRDELRKAVVAITNPDATVQARKRAQAAIYVGASSPQFQVDR